MASFVFVASNVTMPNFEKATEIQIESQGKIKFIPQAVTGQAVITHGMSSNNGILSLVRFEWDHDGEEFGARIVRALAGYVHRQQEVELREPAA